MTDPTADATREAIDATFEKLMDIGRTGQHVNGGGLIGFIWTIAAAAHRPGGIDCGDGTRIMRVESTGNPA